jgi:hypothetical protein
LLCLLVVVNLNLENIFPQTNPPISLNSIYEFSHNEIIQISDSLEIPTWANSVYFSGGYGIPQGFRYELGYNFKSGLSLAFTFGINDNWSNNPNRGFIGVLGKLHYVKSTSNSFYFLFGIGRSVAIFGGSDSYVLFDIGTKIRLYDWLQLCPEVGIDLISKYLSGGPSIFGKSTAAEYENDVKLNLNLLLEIDFRQLDKY